MELKQTNRIRMFTAVITVVESYQAVWSVMAPFVTAFQKFKDKVQAVHAAAQKQGTATAGATLDRDDARDALEGVLFLICQALKVLAHQANDNELRTLANVSPSSIHVMNEVELLNLATTIKEQTVPRASELATLHVSAQNLAELDSAIADFNEAKSAPRAATANRMVQTEALSRLLREANDVLRNELDPMVNLFGRTDPEFVAAYRGARVIVDRTGARQTAPAPQQTGPTSQAPPSA
jgi:hypothetical protein